MRIFNTQSNLSRVLLPAFAVSSLLLITLLANPRNDLQAQEDETPTPTETTVQTAMSEPEPGCIEYLVDASRDIDGQLVVEGSWDEECQSLRPAEEDGARYSRYYVLGLESPAEVTISLESDEDAYLYLLDGLGKDGHVVAENDD